jgi:hypothetical protein
VKKLENSSLKLANRSLLTAAMVAVFAGFQPSPAIAKTVQAGDPDGMFRPVGTFDVMEGNDSSVAEIIDVTVNGKQLVYTDAGNEEIGFVDISDPAHPKGQGTVVVGGEPTSLIVLDPLVLVGVNTSDGDYEHPNGKLVVVHRNTRQIVTEHDIGGQPDSLALAPDRKRAAIVIENERDEDHNDGLLPQEPSGKLLIVDLHGAAKNWKITEADLSPVADADDIYHGNDLEPEFIDINEHNEAVVSFQENNYLAIVDMVTGQTLNHFSAGTVDLENVDADEDDLIELDDNPTKRREPDSVAWIDNETFATANEGDYEDENGVEGGSRGFTIFNKNGNGDVEYESNSSHEHWLVSAGHYAEGRSENKGCEPEGADAGTYGGRRLLFIGSERCNAVGVYDASDPTSPIPLQILPTGIKPEGLKAIPNRNLLAASTEADNVGDGIPTMINLYRTESGPALYPMIESANDENGLPITWVALSGLAGDPNNQDIVYAVSDSFLAEGFIHAVDVSTHPATIVDKVAVTGASEDLDLEGIAVGPDGNFWLASEGNSGARPNLVLKVAPAGNVTDEFPLPGALVANQCKNGFEGIAVTGEAGTEVVYTAIQRAWPDGVDVDGENTKIGRYDEANDEWTFVHYPLQPEGDGGWIGLSELTLLPDGTFAVIERDKGWGSSTSSSAELKAIYGVDLENADFRAYDDPNGLVTISKTLLHDVLPDMAAVSI